MPRNRWHFTEAELRTMQAYSDDETLVAKDATSLVASDVAHSALELLDESQKRVRRLEAQIQANNVLIGQHEATMERDQRILDEITTAAQGVLQSFEHYMYVDNPKPQCDHDEYDEMMAPAWKRLHELVHPTQEA